MKPRLVHGCFVTTLSLTVTDKYIFGEWTKYVAACMRRHTLPLSAWEDKLHTVSVETGIKTLSWSRSAGETEVGAGYTCLTQPPAAHFIVSLDGS